MPEEKKVLKISKDRILNNFVSGKSVCFVGPSPCLIGTNLGSYIDSYDIVCRIASWVPSDYMADYGTKMNILFHVFNEIDCQLLEFREFADNNYWQWQQIDLVVCCAYTTKPYGPFDRSMEELYRMYTHGFAEKPVTFLTLEDHLIHKEMMNIDFNQGSLVMNMLLACDIKSLFVTGMSFYYENQLIPPESSYFPGYSKIYDGIFKQNHDQEHQKKIWIDKFLKPNEDKVKIDSFLRDKVLKIDYGNVKEIDYKGR